jgi:hypothetical protein
VVEADITLTAASGTGNSGFLLRSSNYNAGADAVNGYYVGIGRNTGGNTSIGGVAVAASRYFLQIGRMAQSWNQLYALDLGADFGTEYGATHRLSVSMVGPRMQAFIDGALRATVYDSAYASGSVGFRTYTAAGYADNLVISTAPRYSNSFSATAPNSDASAALFQESWNVASGDWSVAGGRVSASAATAPGAPGSGAVEAAAAFVGNYGWSDYEYSATVRPASEDSVAGVALRGFAGNGKGNGYYVVLNRPEGKIQALRAVKGVTATLAEAPFSFAPGGAADYTLTVRAVNNALRVYANADGAAGAPDTARPLLTVVDSAFPTGQAGAVVLAGEAAFGDIGIRDKFVWQDEFYEGTLSGWKQYGSGTASVANNELTLVQGANGFKLSDGYATWEDYTIKADIKLLVKPGKSNGGFTYLSTDFGEGQDDLRGFVSGVNYNTIADPAPNEHTGVETGAIHYGWTALANTSRDEIEFDPNEWHPMAITVTGGSEGTANIKAWVDGYLCYDYDAPANRDFHYGQIAARVFNSDMKARNLRVIPAGEQEPVVAYSIAGKVLPGATVLGRADGLTVELYGFADEAFSEKLGEAVTGADGGYAFATEMPDGKYVARVAGEAGMREASIAVVDLISDVADADITLRAVKSDLISIAPLSAAVVLDEEDGAVGAAGIALAFYDAAGRLAGIRRVTEADAVDGTYRRLSVSAAAAPSGAASAKAFVWNGAYAPLREAKPVPLG